MNACRRLSRDQLHGLLLHSPSVETLRKPEIHDFFTELLQSGKLSASERRSTLAALEAAVFIPAVSMVQALLQVVKVLPGSAILDHVRQRNTGLFVREVLR